MKLETSYRQISTRTLKFIDDDGDSCTLGTIRWIDKWEGTFLPVKEHEYTLEQLKAIVADMEKG